MLAVGEESGALDDMMEEVGQMYQREVEYELKNPRPADRTDPDCFPRCAGAHSRSRGLPADVGSGQGGVEALVASFLLDSVSAESALVGAGNGLVVAGLLLLCWWRKRWRDLQEEVEKTQVELNVRQMRSGLQWAMGEALLQGKTAEIASWVGSNSMRWLDYSMEDWRRWRTCKYAP